VTYSQPLRQKFFGPTLILITVLTASCTTDLRGVPNASTCEKYSGDTIVGPEDIVYDDSVGGGRLIFSTQNRRQEAEHGKQSAPGTLQWFDLSKGEIFRFTVEGGPDELYPHGIDLVRQPDQSLLLYVVNHGDGESCHSEDEPSKNSIETYFVDGPKLTHKQDGTYSTPLLTNPNDVTATPSGDFYVSNMTQRCSSGIMGTLLDSIPGFRTGSLLKYEATTKTWTTVLSDLFYPNGVSLNRDGSELWLAESGSNSVRVFRPKTDGLDLITAFSISTPDNFSLDDKNILVTSHLSKWQFWRHSHSPDALSPWAIYSLNSTMRSPLPLLQNDGSAMSGASVTVHTDHRLWVGQVFGNYLLSCSD
jgi:sugar lactone lactonase YvrE